MNHFEISISSKGSTIEIGKVGKESQEEEGKGSITNVEIFFDTIDNTVRQKNTSMLVDVTVKGLINQVTRQSTIDLFNWTKEKDSEKWYRSLEVRIYEDEVKVYRKYKFDNIFIVDYKENFRADGSDGEGTFELYLRQKENNIKSIETF